MIFSFISCTFRPIFYTLSMLLIIFPVTLISSTSLVGIYSKSVSFVIRPFSVVNISLNMEEFALTLSYIQLPFTLIACSVNPLHSSLTVPHATLPLATIDCTSLILILTFLNWSILIKDTSQSFICFFCLEVLALTLNILFLDPESTPLKESFYKSLDSN